jgi:hypothetical protein
MKKMFSLLKQLTLFSLVIILLSLISIACSKDDDKSSSIIGKWGYEKVVTNFLTDGKVTDTKTIELKTTDEQYLVIEFKVDSTYEVNYPNYDRKPENGKYSINGNNISITALSDGNETNTYKFELTENSLIIIVSRSESEIKQYMKRL